MNTTTNKEIENKEVKNEAMKAPVTRKPNGAKVKTPVATTPEKKETKAVTAPKKAAEKKADKAPVEKKAPKEKAEKIPTVSKLNRREEVMKQVKLSGTAQWETTETARNKDNSAMVINDGAIMLTNITDKGAKRFLEIYLRARTNDAVLLITKANFLDAIDVEKAATTEKKKARAEFAEQYEKAVQAPKKGSKLTLQLANDADVVTFATKFMLAM